METSHYLCSRIPITVSYHNKIHMENNCFHLIFFLILSQTISKLNIMLLFSLLFSSLFFIIFLVNSRSSFIHCHTCEAEVAFYTLKKLAPTENGMLHSMETVWDAIDYVVPVMELCANRSRSAMTLEQRLVDGLMTGGVFLGNHIVTKQEIANLLQLIPNNDHTNDEINKIATLLSTVETTMACNTVSPTRGKATACPMGGPLQSITWLASKNGFDAGQLILSGMTSKVQAQFNCGDTVTATFEKGVFGNSKHTLSFQWDK